MGTEAMIRRKRVERLLRRVIWPATHPEQAALALSVHELEGEPISYEQAVRGPFEPFELGAPWGGAWSTSWFKATGTIPAAFAGASVVARIDLGFSGQPGFGGEGLLYRDGVELQGINPKHNWARLTKKAAGGEPVELYLEAAANPSPREGPLEWPLLLPDYQGKPLYRLVRFDIATVDSEMLEVLYDWTILTELVDELGLEDRRSAEILDALDRVALSVDLDDLATSIVGRRELWLPLLERPTRAGSHQVFAAGHAHIDSAWLWPIRETKRKCARTFATAVGLMAEEPEFTFVCSQAQQHAWIEQDHPQLFAQMRSFAERGQFEPVGSMWVEPDTNLPSGESLLRQLVFGKRYFLDRYGIETLDCWLPDAFGYSGNLPQLLRAAGVRRFLTQKLSWNEIDTFPHHTFWWEGIDGSRVLAHCPPTDTYNASVTVEELAKGERQFAEHARSDKSLYLFGYGDGGGGPTSEMLSRARRLSDLDPLPRLRLAGASEFFEALEADIEQAADSPEVTSPTAHAPGPGGLPVWVGELYLERHRGVQTTQARGKLGNRRSERLLREAELWAAAFLSEEAALAGGRQLAEAWQLVLLHQFHDILPGSSINWVHRDSLEAYAKVEQLASQVISDALGRLAEHLPPAEEPRLLLLNAATAARREAVEIELANLGDEGDLAVTDEPETGLMTQKLPNGSDLVLVDLPASGWTSLQRTAASKAMPLNCEPVVTGERSMRNGLVEASLGPEGTLISFKDLTCGREAIADGERANLFQLHHDLPNNFDAWDIDQHSFERAFDQDELESLEIVESGPVRASIKLTRRIGRSSRLTQEIRLSAGSKRLEFVTEVDWQESHKLLKVAFPLAVRSPHGLFEIQCGHLERPTHANTSWDAARFEVPAQRWAALGEPGFGISLMNDCKHGYDLRGSVLRLSLLRSPGWPDPEADRGLHHFSYALYPYAGEAGLAEMVSEAEGFNMPVRSFALPASSGDGSFSNSGSVLSLTGAQLTAVKSADDGSGDLVVRFYEAQGSHGRAVLSGLGRRHWWRADALERHLDEAAPDSERLELDLKPFELVTVRAAAV